MPLCQSPQPTRQQSSQSLSVLQQAAPSIEDPPQSSQLTQPLQEPPPQPVESETRPAQVNPEQPPLMPQSSRTPVVTANSLSRGPPPRELSRVDTIQRATATSASATGSGVLTDITNQPTSGSQKQQQQQPVAPRLVGAATTDAAASSSVKKHKRRRLVEDSQDSSNSNSNSSNGSIELTTAQVGIQTMLLQLLQHQPRVEDTLARILSMLTREQTARQQQSMDQDTLKRVHSEEQSKRIEAAARRNEALEGRLARCETERAALHEKLMARETELYMHKHSLEAAIPPLSARVEAIESSHMQQLNVSRVIESKISAVHDFMDELRNAGGEGTEADDSPQRQLGYVAFCSSAASCVLGGLLDGAACVGGVTTLQPERNGWTTPLY
jgi:predicted  nucleic acid-binding Zn-ribbon protein